MGIHVLLVKINKYQHHAHTHTHTHTHTHAPFHQRHIILFFNAETTYYKHSFRFARMNEYARVYRGMHFEKAFSWIRGLFSHTKTKKIYETHTPKKTEK